MIRPPPRSPLFPPTPLFRSALACGVAVLPRSSGAAADGPPAVNTAGPAPLAGRSTWNLRQTPVVEVVRRVKDARSEEHTSELQSHLNLVCRLLLEKKKKPHD